MDLVGTCPKNLWQSWIEEGDAVGEPASGEEWGWFTRDTLALKIQPGERFYIVAHGTLRGCAPVVRVADMRNGTYAICRRGNAVAVTIPQAIKGFRGLRRVWWRRDEEQPFPEWRQP